MPVRAELVLAVAAANKLKDPKPLLKNLETLELQRFGGSRTLLLVSKWFDKLVQAAAPLLRRKP